MVYRWALSIPTISGSGTYTWAAADIGTPPTDWAALPGSGTPGQTLWAASVPLVDSAGSTTSAISWSSASITARGYAGADGLTGQTGISARRAYTLTTASSLGSGTVTTTGISSVPGSSTVFGSGLAWSAAPSTPSAGQVLYQSDGLYNPATDQVTWETPYISALKVGNLAALAVNTGALTVTGDIEVSGGALLGGAFTGWAWPAAGAGGGFYLGPSGLLLGSTNDGKYLQVTAAGDLYSAQFSIVGGAASFSGNLSGANISGATGTFTGSLSGASITGATGTFSGSLNVNSGGSDRMEITATRIKIFNGGVERVRLGDLS